VLHVDCLAITSGIDYFTVTVRGGRVLYVKPELPEETSDPPQESRKFVEVRRF